MTEKQTVFTVACHGWAHIVGVYSTKEKAEEANRHHFFHGVHTYSKGQLFIKNVDTVDIDVVSC